MGVPGVILSSSVRGHFAYQEGYDGVLIEELHELLQLGREMVVSIEVELKERGSLATLPPAAKFCIEKIQANMASLKSLQRLHGKAGLAPLAADTLKNVGVREGRRERIYKQFLEDLQKQCGAGMVILCSSSLGKRRIVELNRMDRTALLGYLKSNLKAFESTILDEQAVTLGIKDPVQRSTTLGRQERQIEYKYSEADINSIALLGPALTSAVIASKQWSWKRRTGGSTTDCINGLSPRDRGDMSLQLLLGFKEGTKIMEQLRMQAI
ncbi:hypothetical protein FSARC_13413 [Fusarium sarcochroum]|uniref:Uncharacterized protein n=1 Tax=Fusarium sarcochroum TaxID=1208366 RepID=A0A8H4T1Q6_9HYPO|nr:hypothetical protein FSARC_13413 [Fusarium sarcochroum]